MSLRSDSALGAISSVGAELMSSGCQQLVFELSGALRPNSRQLLSNLLEPLCLQNPVVRKLLTWQFIPHQANYFFSQDPDWILAAPRPLKAENILPTGAGKPRQDLCPSKEIGD